MHPLDFPSNCTTSEIICHSHLINDYFLAEINLIALSSPSHFSPPTIIQHISNYPTNRHSCFGFGRFSEKSTLCQQLWSTGERERAERSRTFHSHKTFFTFNSVYFLIRSRQTRNCTAEKVASSRRTMSDDHGENGNSSADVPEIELIIKVRFMWLC